MELWDKVLSETLGKEYNEYVEELSILFSLVDQGVKPSFMWDYSPIEPHKLANALNILQKKELIQTSLKVIMIEMDCFVANLDTMTKVLVDYLTTSFSWLIDISTTDSKVAISSVHETFKSYICSILRQLGIVATQGTNNKSNVTTVRVNNTCSSSSVSEIAEDSSNILSIILPDITNLSTVFGCLLGYPQIYWWGSESTGSSLSGMPLKIYSFSANCSYLSDDEDDIEVFSFSIPESLEGELKPSVKHWGNVINSRVGQTSNFSEVKFNCDPVLCLDVAL